MTRTALKHFKEIAYAGLTLIYAHSAAHAESELAISVNQQEATLSWLGGESLQTSTDLLVWTPLEDATSPFTRDITGTPREFYQLEALPPQPTAVSIPSNGNTLGSASVPVSGSISTALSGTPGLSVLVNGQTATIQVIPGSPDQFILPSTLNLSAGSNTINIVITNAAGDSETQELTVNYSPIVANNITISEGFAFAAQGGSGLAIMNLETRERITLPAAIQSIPASDLSIDGNLLFILDAENGIQNLIVLNISDPANPQLVANDPISSSFSFFAGVAAANNRVILSGGTSLLTVRTYTDNGVVGSDVSSIDLGAGQPDVLIAPDGRTAYVSTDFSGNVDGEPFGITELSINNPPAAPTVVDRVGIDQAGFTTGFRFPSNFPIESALLDNLLLVANGGGLSIINTTSSNSLRTLDLGFSATSVDTNGDRVFVVGVQTNNSVSRLAEIDFSNPNSPSIVRSLEFSGTPNFTGVAANEGYIVIATNDASGIEVIAR